MNEKESEFLGTTIGHRGTMIREDLGLLVQARKVEGKSSGWPIGLPSLAIGKLHHRYVNQLCWEEVLPQVQGYLVTPEVPMRHHLFKGELWEVATARASMDYSNLERFNWWTHKVMKPKVWIDVEIGWCVDMVAEWDELTDSEKVKKKVKRVARMVKNTVESDLEMYRKLELKVRP